MTEEERYRMVESLCVLARRGRDSVSMRKCKLFAVACYRLDPNHLKLQSIDLFDVAERDADRRASKDEILGIRRIVENLFGQFRESILWMSLGETGSGSCILGPCLWRVSLQTTMSEEDLVSLLHEIFGNPFRPVSLDPTWLTSDVLALARGIYANCAFDQMPILADALQDAGCDNENILTHCRDTSLTHVRGCWVVDLLLAKE